MFMMVVYTFVYDDSLIRNLYILVLFGVASFIFSGSVMRSTCNRLSPIDYVESGLEASMEEMTKKYDYSNNN